MQSQFIREEDFSSSPSLINTAFRIALGMGLHRDLPQADFTPAEFETRRRLWWYILHLDVMSSSSSGLSPLFINDRMTDAGTISQVDELNSSRGREVDVRYLVAARRYEVTTAIRTILRAHFEDSLQSPGQVQEAVKNLDKALANTHATTRQLLDSASSQFTRISTRRRPLNPILQPYHRTWGLDLNEKPWEVTNFCGWSALLLHLMVHKAFCILYHPLFKEGDYEAHVNIRRR